MEKRDDAISSFAEVELFGEVCDGTKTCKDGIDESNCHNDVTELRSGLEIKSAWKCNGYCDLANCEDEADCNSLTYGLYCKSTLYWWRTVKHNFYIPPRWICDSNRDCDDGEDEENCTVTETTENFCKHYNDEREVPVFNFTRCTAIIMFREYSERNQGKKVNFNRYCNDQHLKKYQTNCTDPARIGGRCYVDGHLSTVSEYMICSDKTVSICDDSIQSQCRDISTSCLNMHKHVMCDNVTDCSDESDEKHIICHKLTISTCQRKIGKVGELRLPLAWLGDNTQDCVDGSDEQDIWPTCGKEITRRNVISNETCENVFLCIRGTLGFVELNELCDGVETCGNENTICS